MNQSQPKTIFLKDYKPHPFSIESVNLIVDIHDDFTTVQSHLRVKKRNEDLGKKLNLTLNGEGLELLDIKMNGSQLSSHQFEVSTDRLVILNILEDEFTLDIKNKIFPHLNTALEGFYQSGPQLCTQCEPEGFRRITYFIDRPDIMAKFTTKMIANREKYPFLLSNGNKVDSGILSDGRHWVVWDDPFKKPSYLFAMVAGDFDLAKDTFQTQTGRTISLEIYVDRGNLFKTPHAMTSLKQSMQWDEERFGLEYDLDVYMIVSVDSFNMGAMENKGLNIFNSTYTLADKKTATDSDFQNIQGVIGHEYFHNWTGNRVTCRDWFQLTLKEGLTVFRDQEFSSDMLSRAVKRLEDVKLLREFQFAEDSGPLAHPIRPESYIEINNFYTRTVYEKGAEIIRMIQTLIGQEQFRKGMDEYFRLFDGMAVTTDDFILAMENASGKDLSQFKNWYSRAGTPTLIIKSSSDGKVLNLDIEQSYPISPSQHKVSDSNILQLPLVVGIIDKNSLAQEEHVLEINSLKENFKFDISGEVILSLNRGFSAPVYIEYAYDMEGLLFLMGHDSDPYARYEATQRIYEFIFNSHFESFHSQKTLPSELPTEFKKTLGLILNDQKIDLSYKAYLLELPTLNTLSQNMKEPDFNSLELIRIHLKKLVGSIFFEEFRSDYQKLTILNDQDLTPHGYGARAYRNQCLSYLVASEHPQRMDILSQHYFQAANMTDEIHALALFIQSGVSLDDNVVQSFYKKWQHDSLVMIKWFGAIASFSPQQEVLKRLKILEADKLFQHQVPNYLRALYLQFAKNNLAAFHHESGESYDFLVERIIKIDAYNPQVASRLASAFSLIQKVDANRQALMRKSLSKVMQASPSRDVFETLSKYL